MYFVKKFHQGGADNPDPRLKEYAEFKCECCNTEPWIDITFNTKFDFERIRKCPDCGMIDEKDYLKTKKSKIESLTEEKSKIEIEIEQLCREVETAELKGR